jgi:O-antigen ligase
MRTVLASLRRRLPRGPRLERLGFAALVAAVVGMPMDEGPTWLFSVPLVTTAVCGLIRWFRTGRWPLRRSPVDLPLLLFAVLALASLLWAESPRHTWSLWGRDFGRGALIALLVFTHVTSLVRARQVVIAFALGAAVCGVVGVVQRIHHADAAQYRAFGTFGHPNHAADLLLAALILLLALPGGRRAAWLRGLAALPMAVTLFFTLSRAAWMGTALAFVVFGLLRRRRLMFVGVGFAALVVVLALVLPANYVGERIRGLIVPDRFVAALHDRPAIWKGSLELIRERPIVGHGYGHKNFHHAWERLENRPDRLYGAAHNTVLHVVFETGLFGLALHLWILTALLRRVIGGYRRARDPALRSLLAAVLAILAGWGLLGLTVEHLLLEQMTVVIGVVAALGFAAAALAEREPTSDA